MECKNKLDVLQRRMIRFILDLDFRAHIDGSHLKCLGWLSVSDRAKYFRLLHVFRINSKQSPEYLMENFTRVNAIHSHSTRGSAANFFVPKIGPTEILRKSFFFSGICDWNSLPLEIKSIQSEKSFKTSLKAYMAAMYWLWFYFFFYLLCDLYQPSLFLLLFKIY